MIRCRSILNYFFGLENVAKTNFEFKFENLITKKKEIIVKLTLIFQVLNGTGYGKLN